MCLLITQTSKAETLTDDYIEDFYWYNSDGIGVMYAEGSDLVVKKALPKNSDECIEFWRTNVDGKDCAIHLRMRTHGPVDIDNCHPYLILPGMWLMHNGILPIGNDADKSKSDTWHYINVFLRPLLAKDPSLAFDDAFIEVISKHIGSSNKFVIMDDKGNLAHYNRDSGVTWGERWMSNTYAWTVPGQSRSYSRRYGKKDWAYSGVYGKYDYDWEWGNGEAINVTAEKAEKVREIGVTFTADGWDEDDNKLSSPKIPVEVEVEDALEFLESAGHYKAASVSKRQAIQFAERFEPDALWELAQMVDDEEIDEYQFVRCVSDFRLYKQLAGV